MLKSQKIDYHDGSTVLEGYLAYQNDSQKRPAILIAHDWSGKNEFACHKANQMAELGYVGFALDMFGKGILGRTKEEKSKLIQPLMQNRTALCQRMQSGLTAIKSLEFVDTNRIAVIGFCFGGLCALDLARSGADIKGVVSFHGLLQAPTPPKHNPIKAKILALHGYNDPMVPPEAVTQFAAEMTAAQADWQVHMYGHTLHAFTNPEANDSGFGTVYNKLADIRSWTSMKAFFNEIFS